MWSPGPVRTCTCHRGTRWGFPQDRPVGSPLPHGAWLAPEPKDALDVAREAALGLLLQLVLEGREGHVVEGQVEEQGLARHGLEAGREVHEAGLLGDEGGVQAERLKPLHQGLEGESEGGSGRARPAGDSLCAAPSSGPTVRPHLVPTNLLCPT